MGCAQSVALDASRAKPQGKGRGQKRIVPLTDAAGKGGKGCTVPPRRSSIVPLPDDLQPSAAAEPALGARELFTSEYELGNTLGKGSFGIVMSARERNSQRVDAVKIVDSADGQDKKWELAMQEVDVWRAVGTHPSVAELRRVFCDSRVVFMVMERCECTVSEKVDSNPELLQSGLPHLLHQMLLGLEACHQASVVHRDVKPDNYLIGLDGSTVKLCDFNLSALLSPGQTLAGEFGTAPFMSPEMLTARHGIGTDVWSYGVMAYFMLFGELPYIPQETTSKAAMTAIRAGVPAPRYLNNAHCKRGNDSMTFCSDLLQRAPSQRCSARDALGHSYFSAAFDAKKGPAMTDTQSTLDPFEYDTLESDGESECSSSFSELGDSEVGETLGLPTSA
jgi:serine/threonine protein kinase